MDRVITAPHCIQICYGASDMTSRNVRQSSLKWLSTGFCLPRVIHPGRAAPYWGLIDNYTTPLSTTYVGGSRVRHAKLFWPWNSLMDRGTRALLGTAPSWPQALVDSGRLIPQHCTHQGRHVTLRSTRTHTLRQRNIPVIILSSIYATAVIFWIGVKIAKT